MPCWCSPVPGAPATARLTCWAVARRAAPHPPPWTRRVEYSPQSLYFYILYIPSCVLYMGLVSLICHTHSGWHIVCRASVMCGHPRESQVTLLRVLGLVRDSRFCHPMRVIRCSKKPSFCRDVWWTLARFLVNNSFLISNFPITYVTRPTQ